MNYKIPKLVKTLIFLAILPIASCVFLTKNNLNQTINQNSFLSRFPQNQKAIVIFKIRGKPHSKAWLCREQNYELKNLDDCHKIYSSNQYQILMLEPSIYYLHSPLSNSSLFPEVKVSSKTRSSASIEIKAGELVYAGDLSIKNYVDKNSDEENLQSQEVANEKVGDDFVMQDSFKSLQNLLKKQDYEKAEQLFANQIWEINYLFKEYPMLENRFIKRLAKQPH